MLYAGRAPAQALLEAAVYVRALRSALRMSQAQLSRRSGVPQSHIVGLEKRRIDPQLGTLRKLLDAMFCDLIVVPRARKRPSEAYAERRVERFDWIPVWD